jgi:hypothetical protein
VCIDFGTFYASKTFFDSPNQRQVLFGWANYHCAGTNWAGIQTFPRVVTLDPTNTTGIVTNPIPEIAKLYVGVPLQVASQMLAPGQTVLLGRGVQLDVMVVVQANRTRANSFTLSALASVNVATAVKTTVQTVATAAAAPTQAYAFMSNYDLPGGDYSINNTFGINSTDPHACEALCKADPSCKAWTFVAPGVQTPSARCCLKNLINAPVAHLGITRFFALFFQFQPRWTSKNAPLTGQCLQRGPRVSADACSDCDSQRGSA